MTPEERAAIEARDAAIGTGNHARKQFGPTAVRAILDRRHLLVALREAEAENARLREAAETARLRDACEDILRTDSAYQDPAAIRARLWAALIPVEPEAERP